MTKDEKLANWGHGPWVDEADHVHFEHAGLACIVHRVDRTGHLCGYAAVGPRHPWYGKGYDHKIPREAADMERPVGSINPVELFIAALGDDQDSFRLSFAIDVHGALTYAEANCETIGNVDTPDAWWFGFDCAHAGDKQPYSKRYWEKSGHPEFAGDGGDVYRDMNYVTAQTKRLAEQLKAAQ